MEHPPRQHRPSPDRPPVELTELLAGRKRGYYVTQYRVQLATLAVQWRPFVLVHVQEYATFSSSQAHIMAFGPLVPDDLSLQDIELHATPAWRPVTEWRDSAFATSAAREAYVASLALRMFGALANDS
jgi:hypothetical protein